MPALALYNFGNAVFSAIGDTKKPLYFLTAAGVLNIMLNLFFVIVCQHGRRGRGAGKHHLPVSVGVLVLLH